MLAECPKLTKKNLISGSFQRDFEKYLSEQFPGRMKMVSLQTKLSRLLGIKDANGVYFGSDGYLLEQYAERDFDWKLAEKNCKRTARFLKKYPNAKVLFVPVKSSVMSNYLPPFAQITGEARFFSLVEQQIPKRQRIEKAKLLNAHQKEYIYYRTDHHWTTPIRKNIFITVPTITGRRWGRIMPISNGRRKWAFPRFYPNSFAWRR